METSMNRQEKRDALESFFFALGVVSVIAVPALWPWKASSPPPSKYICWELLNKNKSYEKCKTHIDDGSLYYENCKWHVR